MPSNAPLDNGATAAATGTPAAPGTATTADPATGTPASGTGTEAAATAPCTGVPITPDATGLVAAGTNSLGIHGSWFSYSDCNDLKNQNCAMVTAPTGTAFTNVGGKMCTSGQTSSSPGAWGAGLGLELNDGPPQMPFDTTAAGIKGFCFELSGSAIPTTSIRVAFPTVGNQDGPYFESVTTPGQHTVLFSETAQGSWVTPKSDFAPTAVTLIQFQIPSDTAAPVPWDFCVEGLTAITE